MLTFVGFVFSAGLWNTFRSLSSRLYHKATKWSGVLSIGCSFADITQVDGGGLQIGISVENSISLDWIFTGLIVFTLITFELGAYHAAVGLLDISFSLAV
jgi:hypothetical protein